MRSPTSASAALSVMALRTTSQSARRYWKLLITQCRASETPSRSASASASSIWNPGSGPRLLEYGSALGCAQTASNPRWPMASSERGSAPAMLSASSNAAAPPSATARPIRPASMISVRNVRPLFLEAPDIGQDRVDLAFGKRLAECRHCSGLSFPDPVDHVLVAALAARELRRLAALAAAVLVAKAAQSRKHLLAIDVVRRGLRPGRSGPAGRARNRLLSLLRGPGDGQDRKRGAPCGRPEVPHHRGRCFCRTHCPNENTTSAPASLGMLL